MWKYIWVPVFACCAFAAERADLNGTWQLEPSQSRINGGKELKSETLVIEQKADSVAVSELTVENAGAEKKLNIQCNTMGKECKLKEDGQPVQVSAWYNGPALVIMEVHGKSDGEATRKRLTTSDDGKTLKLEVVHITPPGPADNYTFTKQVAQASNAAVSAR